MNHQERVFSILLAVICLFFSRSETVAQTNAMADGDWSNAGTWDAGEPDSDTAALIDNGHTVTITQSGETTNLVDVGTASGETGTLAITGGDLFVANLAGSDVFPSTIRIGQTAGSTGTFDMSGGAVFIDGAVSGFGIGELIVGDNGTGVMNATGGHLTASDEVVIGLAAGSEGTVNVSGGTVESGTRNVLVGFSGTGALNISGTGTVNAADFVFASFFPGSASSITQSGGTFNAGTVVLGRQASSSFDHTGGALTGNVLVVADNFPLDGGAPPSPPATAEYNISGGATATFGALTIVGAFSGAAGTVNQTGGTFSSGGILVGRDGTGTWNISGGVLNQTGSDPDPSNNNLIVGQIGFRDDFAQGTGTIDQTGGDVSVATNVFLGNFDNSEGTYRISDGTLNVTGNVSVGGALASNAPPDDVRVDPADPNDPQGQALDANGTFIVSGSDATLDIGGNFLANPADKHPFRTDASHVNGDNTATLIFEIFDGSGTSLIDVAGVADLDGAVVDLDLMGGFTPSIGQTFDLLLASSFGATGSGTTQNVGTGEGFMLAAEDAGSFSLAVVSALGGEVLRATFLSAPTLVGDYNGDGTVDAADYVVWRKDPASFGGAQGYADWRANFGEMSPGAGSAEGRFAAPEPASWLLFAVALGAGFVIRRGRQ